MPLPSEPLRLGYDVEQSYRCADSGRALVAMADLLRGNVALDTQTRNFTIAFVGSEKHRAVSYDGTAKRTAELVEYGFGFHRRRVACVLYVHDIHAKIPGQYRRRARTCL